VNYVPVREYLEDAVEQVEWLKANPAAEKCIRDGGAEFARRILTRETFACYIWRLLTAFKRLQPWESRTEGFSAL